MTSSLDEALRLLNKWKAESTLLMVGASGPSPDTPRTFSFSFAGTVTEVSDRRLEIRGESVCSFRAGISGAGFEYSEPSDRRLDLSVRERDEADRVVSAALAVLWPDGYSCLLTVLREGLTFVRD